MRENPLSLARSVAARVLDSALVQPVMRTLGVAAPGESWLVVCETAIAVLLLAAFVMVRDLPMVDLPQHAAQLAVWLNSGRPEYHADQFVLNFRTPYLLAYLLARLFASAIGVVAAFKVVIWLAVIGQVLGLHFLCKRLSHDPWMALLGLPLAFGYNFLFGFVSYILALPLLYVCVGIAARYATRPSLAGGTMLVATLIAVLLAHGIAFAQALLFVSLLLVFGKGSFGVRVLPFLLPICVAAAWLLPGSTTTRLGDDLWEPSLGRLMSLPGLLVGSGGGDIKATVYGTLLLLVIGLVVGPPLRELGRLLPGIAVVLGFCAFPETYRGYGPLWPRFAVLVVPAMLLASGPDPDKIRAAAFGRRITCLAAAMTWVGLFGLRWIDFNHETAPLHGIIGAMPRGLRVRPIVFEADSRAFPGLPALNHLPSYYFVAKGGILGYSFAMYPSSVIRYRDGIVPKMSGGQEWAPEAFRVEAELRDYDCFIVHSKRDRHQELFGASDGAVELYAHAGDWWSYCR